MDEPIAQRLKKRPSGVKLTILFIMLAATVCAFVFHDYIYGEKTLFEEDVSRFGFLNMLWRAIPRVVKSLQIATIILVVATVFMMVTERVMSKTQRGITVSRLISSFLKWIIAIVLIIVVLAVWGVNTTALITGAGVVTLVIGLGMQSLIADVVAGLFIVFENEFNVGDIITVGDFRGTVVSIGIRTTRLENLGNLKIINNNEIKGVLNQTYKLSVAYSYVEISYDYEIPAVEKIIAENLPALEIEGAQGEVSYDGVDEFGASGVRLQFSVSCKEGDIFAVRRNMNRAIKIMFDENGVEIPYTQLVLHEAEKPAPLGGAVNKPSEKAEGEIAVAADSAKTTTARTAKTAKTATAGVKKRATKTTAKTSTKTSSAAKSKRKNKGEKV